MKVLANSFDRLWEDCRGDYMAAVERVGASGWYILGDEVSAFEQDLSKFCGNGTALGCANGMDALEIALRTAGIGVGDKVLTTPLSAFPTVLGILRAGAEPVFCDVDDHGLMDPAAAANALSSISGIKAVMPVHLYGNLADMSSIGNLAKDARAIVIEDAAQAIGATRNGAGVASHGNMACFSFYPTKNLGAVGDGGAVMLPEGSDLELASSIRNYGQTRRYVHDVIGLNSRLDELHAATLRSAFLPRLGGWLTRRRAIAMRYLDGLNNFHVKLLPGPDTMGGGWHLFPVLVDADRRESFMAHLADANIQGGLHYPILIPEQKAMTGLGTPIIADDLKRARRLCEQEVSLPIHPYLHDDEIDHVIETVNAWAG